MTNRKIVKIRLSVLEMYNSPIVLVLNPKFPVSGMVQRVTYRRRHCYATRSNKVTQVKTPGGKLTIHYNRKGANAPKCGDCGGKISGVPAVRALEMKKFKSRSRSVARAYGGSRCGHCVRQR